jgi:hypothetical protein
MTEPFDPSQGSPDDRWRQLGVQVDLYKFFFDWTLKLDIFYYTLTGAIVSFFLSRPIDLRYSLLLPFFLSFLLGVFFWIGSKGLKASEIDVHAIARPLKMRFDIRYLRHFSLMNAAMCFFNALVLLLAIIFVKSIFPQPPQLQPLCGCAKPAAPQRQGHPAQGVNPGNPPPSAAMRSAPQPAPRPSPPAAAVKPPT